LRLNISKDMGQISCTYNSPLGWLEITTEKDTILSLKFVPQPKKQIPYSSLFQKEIVKQLKAYFEHKNYDFNFKLSVSGTLFQKKVWAILKEIPQGSTISYLKIAQSYGNTKAVRAVAGAISKNPILILVPCHRVVGSDGSLVGYSGGLANKKALLTHEGYRG